MRAILILLAALWFSAIGGVLVAAVLVLTPLVLGVRLVLCTVVAVNFTVDACWREFLRVVRSLPS